MRRFLAACAGAVLALAGVVAIPEPASAGTVNGVTATVINKKASTKTQAKITIKFSNTANKRVSVKMWVDGERKVANHGVKHTTIGKKEKKRKVNFNIPCGRTVTVKLEYKRDGASFGDSLWVNNVPGCKKNKK